jgi:hypothetical protein
MVYPLLQEGVHELPLRRVDEHPPQPPSAGVVTVHGLGLHSKLSLKVPYEHALLPDAVYPLLHVGVHEAPLSKLDVHVPAPPFVGAAAASHGSPARTERKACFRRKRRRAPPTSRERYHSSRGL